MVCSEKEEIIVFLQSEKVDPELHLFILLQFSVLCAKSLSEQCHPQELTAYSILEAVVTLSTGL